MMCINCWQKLVLRRMRVRALSGQTTTLAVRPHYYNRYNYDHFERYSHPVDVPSITVNDMVWAAGLCRCLIVCVCHSSCGME